MVWSLFDASQLQPFTDTIYSFSGEKNREVVLNEQTADEEGETVRGRGGEQMDE